MATVIAVIYIFAADIIAVFVGSGFDLAVYSLKILCWVPLFSLADTLFGYLFIALEKRRVYISVVLIGSFLCLILNLSLTPRYNLIGSSYSWLCAEICCFVCFVLYFAIKVLPSVKSVPPTTFNATLK
jgi:O-antigen/teichoic acid export membrane protein